VTMAASVDFTSYDALLLCVRSLTSSTVSPPLSAVVSSVAIDSELLSPSRATAVCEAAGALVGPRARAT
jgi:hypothetical protein